MKRKCIKCKKMLPLDQFRQNATLKTSYNQCTECHKRYYKEFYERKKAERNKIIKMLGFPL